MYRCYFRNYVKKMNQSEIIEYATARGADVVSRKSDASQNSETICVHVGFVPAESIMGI